MPLFGNTVVRLTLTLPKIWTGNSGGRAGLLLITGYISLGNILALSCSSVHPSKYKCVRMLEHFLSFLGAHVTVHLLCVCPEEDGQPRRANTQEETEKRSETISW